MSVPKILDVLREHALRDRHRQPADTAGTDAAVDPEAVVALPPHPPHVRAGSSGRLSRRGAAATAIEEFWKRLGFAVIQGYGLTETAPIVTLNHPFKTSTGSVGTPIGGVEVKIADDGEILVRGENVTSGYFEGAGGAGVVPEVPEPNRCGGRTRDAGWLAPHRRHR